MEYRALSSAACFCSVKPGLRLEILENVGCPGRAFFICRRCSCWEAAGEAGGRQSTRRCRFSTGQGRTASEPPCGDGYPQGLGREPRTPLPEQGLQQCHLPCPGHWPEQVTPRGKAFQGQGRVGVGLVERVALRQGNPQTLGFVKGLSFKDRPLSAHPTSVRHCVTCTPGSKASFPQRVMIGCGPRQSRYVGTAGLSTPHGAGSLEDPCRGWLTRDIPGLDQDVQCTSARTCASSRESRCGAETFPVVSGGELCPMWSERNV